MADDQSTPPLPPEVAVLPLRGTVSFPLSVQPLAVNRPVSVESVNRALGGDRMVLLVLQEGEADDPTADQMKRIGTVGIIRQMARNPSASTSSSKASRACGPTWSRAPGTSMRAQITPMPGAGRTNDRGGRVRPPPAGADRARAVARERPLAGAARRRRAASTIRCGSPTCSRSLLDMKADEKQPLLEAERAAHEAAVGRRRRSRARSRCSR